MTFFSRALRFAPLLALGLAPSANAQSLRVEVGGGAAGALVFGDLNAEAEALTGVNDFTGGGVGVAANVTAWLDFPLGISLGVQGFYDHAGIDTEIDGNDINGDRDAYGAMLLAALRGGIGPYHPYVGAGIGQTWVDASYEQFDNDFLEVELDGDYSSLTGTLFTGFDVDVTPWTYLGLRLAARADRGEVEATFGGSADWTQVTTTITAQVGVNF